MGLEARLRRIRGQVPAPALPSSSESSVPEAPSLAERLARISTGREARHRDRPPDESALGEALGARLVAPGVLCLERRLSVRLRHGRGPLGAGMEPRTLPLPKSWPGPEDGPGPWVCLDTETSGLSGGTGTWAFLTGLLRQDADGWLLRQYLLTRLDAESAYLEQVRADLEPPVRLLSYNGRAFDVPLLVTRFRLAGQPDPLARLPHLDLLAQVRRAFGRRWPDCRLATAESQLLGFNRRDDLPGSAAPQAWLGWLRRGESNPLAGVLRHNRFDLLSLAGLLPVLDSVYGDPATHGADPRAVAAAHQARGNQARALGILAANRHLLEPSGLLDLASLYRRAGRWDQAVRIWESLEAAGEPEARAALARFYEHRSKDIDRALALAQRLPPGDARERRLLRLESKRARARRNLCLTWC